MDAQEHVRETDSSGPEQHTQTVRLFPSQLDAFMAEVGKLNAKAEKWGLPPVIAEKPIPHTYYLHIDCTSYGAHHSYSRHGNPLFNPSTTLLHITVHYPILRLGQYEVIGRVEVLPEDGARLTTAFRPEHAKVISRYRDCAPDCDHCHTQRKRNEIYVLRDLDTGELKQVGTSCVTDFTGHDPGALLNYAQLYTYVNDCLDPFAGDGCHTQPSAMPTDLFLKAAAFLTRTVGFISSAKAKDTGLTPTYREAVELVLSREPAFAKTRQVMRQQDAPLADDVTRIRAAYANPGHSDFAQNAHALLRQSVVPLAKSSHLAILAAAAGVTARERQQVAATHAQPSVHFGTQGTRYTEPLRYLRHHLSDTAFGVSAYVHFEDRHGNHFVWHAATPPQITTDDAYLGRWFTATFTVKDHAAYRGVDQTNIARVKLEALEHAPDAADTVREPATQPPAAKPRKRTAASM